MMRRTWKRLVAELTFAVGLGAIVWLVMRLGWSSIAHALAYIGVRGVLILALAHIPTLVVLGLAWWAVARHATQVAPSRFIWARLVREASGELLPFSQVAGFALGARALALAGTPWIVAAASSLLDVFAEQAAKTPYTLVGVAMLLRLSHNVDVVGPALALVGVTTAVVVLVVLKRKWVRGRLEALAETMAQKWQGRSGPGPAGAGAAVRHALAPGGGLGLSLALHLTGWFLGGAETWLAFTLLGAHLTLPQALVIDGLFTTVKVFAFSIPGAVGVQEAAYVVLAGLFAVPAPIAVAFSLVRRGRDLVLGGPALLAWQLVERNRRSAGPKRAADSRELSRPG
jgi:putative membrane protein